MNFIESINESSKELKKVKSVTGSALFAAMNIILDYFRIVISASLEITFAFLALAVGGMLYGPVVTAIMGGVADVVAYLIKPNGFFFPGFTFNTMLSGFIYGLFLYKKQPTLKRVALAVLTTTVIINLILTPIWLKIMYGNELFAIVRVIKNVIQYPVNVALCYVVCKNVGTVRSKILNN